MVNKIMLICMYMLATTCMCMYLAWPSLILRCFLRALLEAFFNFVLMLKAFPTAPREVDPRSQSRGQAATAHRAPLEVSPPTSQRSRGQPLTPRISEADPTAPFAPAAASLC